MVLHYANSPTRAILSKQGLFCYCLSSPSKKYKWRQSHKQLAAFKNFSPKAQNAEAITVLFKAKLTHFEQIEEALTHTHSLAHNDS